MAHQPISPPIIGHQTVMRYLERCLRRGTVGHAYVLVGPNQIGKATIAKHLAAALLCDNGQSNGSACEECTSCRLRSRGVHPDLHLVEPVVPPESVAGNPSINLSAIRTLQSNLSHRPVASARKVAVVLGAERLNPQAANALLKTVEEPSGRTVVILTCEMLGALPATLASRCLVLRLSLVSTSDITDWLRASNVPQSQAQRLAQQAAGRPGLALEFYQHPEILAEHESQAANFSEILGHGFHQRLRIAAALHQSAVAQGGGVAERLRQQLSRWVSLARDRLLATAGCPHLAQQPASVMAAPMAASGPWQQLIDALSDLQLALRQNANPRWVLDQAVLAFPLA